MISSRANGPLNDSVEEFHGPKRSSLTDVRGVPQKRRDAGLVIFAPPELPPAASGAQSAKQEHLLARSSTSSSSSGKLVRLHKAARQGLLDVIDRALRASPGLVDSRDEAGRTPLHWAARKNRNRVAELLLALGADANAIDNDGMCPMHLSAACGMETNTASSSSSSVFDSCSSERVFTVHDVVDLRQDMDSARRRTDRCSFVLPHAGFTVPGQTSSEPDVPFPPPQPHEAGAVVIVGSSLMRSSFRPDFVELLDSVENGAQSTRIQGRLGGIQRVSSACRRTGCESSRAGGGAANECQPPDAQPRHRPIGRSETISSPRGCESKAGILAIMGDRDDAEPSRPAAAKTNTWVNPCPSEFESTDLWKTVSETPRPSTDGSDVIAFVPRQTKTKTVMDMLLNHGAEIDARDANGRTPLHWAAWKGRDDSVAWLLRHGAQPHVADGDGRCAIHLASISGSLMVIQASNQTTPSVCPRPLVLNEVR